MSHATRARRGSNAFLEALGSWLRGRTSPAGKLSRTLASAVRPFTTAERALPVAVAAIVAVASMLALMPSTPAGAAGAAQGSSPSPRLAINGAVRSLESTDGLALGTVDAQKVDTSFQPVTVPTDVTTLPSAEQ
ncbi:MAG TPA: hypothetical protein VIR16_03480, partial [Candidatus Limnocylindrales bacterium]